MSPLRGYTQRAILLLLLALTTATQAQNAIEITADKQLKYHPEPNGDRVPDFSYCGYRHSEMPIPNVPVKIIVAAMNEDATNQIQAAIDYVGALPLDANGFRGTVLLEKGNFQIAGSLAIRHSGVVLRGSGTGPGGTMLTATGTDRETLIRVTGINNRTVGKPIRIADSYYPVHSKTLIVPTGHGFRAGDQVLVNRPSTRAWLEKIGADKIGLYVDYQLTKWEPGDFDQNWYRTITTATPTSVTIDVPLTNSLDSADGGGTIATYQWDGQISQVGVENLQCISTFDAANPKDENHRWMAITIENARDCWVRRIVARNFVSSAAAVWETASRITVEDCKSLSPVGEIGNYRRAAFQTLGQQVLFQRCYSEFAYHPFSVGFTAAGPNAFVQCYAFMPSDISGALGGWSSGVLFDKVTVDGGIISFDNRDVDGQGGGWSTANSVCWQCRSAQLRLVSPPAAQNWAFGSWAQGYGNGHHQMPHSFLKPESLFYAQLEGRTGKKSPEEEKILIYETDRTTAPNAELTARLNERSKKPDLTMEGWIDQMIQTYPLVNNLNSAKKQDYRVPQKPVFQSVAISIRNGWILSGDQVLTGRKNRTSLWRGTTRPGELSKAAPNLVRFVPGRTGRGLTDDLDTLVHYMMQHHVAVMQHFPALWYERRRDDHARTRRANADVWSPFYEQPFSRSGQGEAYDRLSRYDLTKWNSWYWMRLKQFATHADQHGLLFIQEHYLQHNIIEEGAHWADYPWRTANNINQTGFPENAAYAGDKRVFMAEQFYDTSSAERKKLHRDYIRKSLDNFKGNTNIIHHLGVEYTGPLGFMAFWLDVIGEWERENKIDVKVMIPGTKEVQDAILADPKRAALVDGIDVIQWQYRKDGSLYAPVGGQSLAERQYARILQVGETSLHQVYRAVTEFHQNYPEKAITYSRGGVPYANWAVFMAGGSLANLPYIADKRFLQSAVTMKPIQFPGQDTAQFMLGDEAIGYITFSVSEKIPLHLPENKNRYRLFWIKPATGEIFTTRKRLSPRMVQHIEAPFKGPAVAWLLKEK